MTYVSDDGTILASPEWTVSPRTGTDEVFAEDDRIGTLHPAYTIPEQKARIMIEYFASKAGF